MDHETEMIREQMEERCDWLAPKIESLEKEAAGAIEHVKDTVPTVSHRVQQGSYCSLESCAKARCSSAKSTGLVRCRSKPASKERRWSSSWP
jgi:hypothetical protein